MSPVAPPYGKSNQSDKLLRFVLWEKWSHCCYWCNRVFEDSTFAQIDHILPRANFEAARKAFGLPPSFELNEAENLAPICGSGRQCNPKKPEEVNKLLRMRGAIEGALVDAADRAPLVRERQLHIGKAQGTEKAFVSFISEGVTAKTRKLSEEYGSAIVQRFVELAPSVVESYFTTVEIPGSFGPALPHEGWAPTSPCTLMLNSEGRFAFAIAENVFQVKLESVISKEINRVLEMLAARVEDEAPQDSRRYQSRGSLSTDYAPILTLDFTRWYGHGKGKLTASFDLRVEQSWSGSGVSSNHDGDLVEDSLEWESIAVISIKIVLNAKGYKSNYKVSEFTLLDENEYYRYFLEFDEDAS